MPWSVLPAPGRGVQLLAGVSSTMAEDGGVAATHPLEPSAEGSQPPLKKRRSAWDLAGEQLETKAGAAPLPGFVPATAGPAVGTNVVEEAPSAPPAAGAEQQQEVAAGPAGDTLAPPPAEHQVPTQPVAKPLSAEEVADFESHLESSTAADNAGLLGGQDAGLLGGQHAATVYPGPPAVQQPYDIAGQGIFGAPTTQPVSTEDIEVPLNAVGLLIGKGGETIKRLQVQSSAHIQVEKDVQPGTNYKIVHVQGPPEEIRAAKALIGNIIDLAASYEARDSGVAAGPTPASPSGGILQGPIGDEVEEVVLVPNKHVGAVIGKGGETISMLTARSGAKIQVRKDADHNPNDPQRPITVIGKKEQVDEARRLLMDTVTRAESGQPMETSLVQEYRLPGHIEEHVFIPNDCVGPIIGKSGSTIQMMQQQVISFPSILY